MNFSLITDDDGTTYEYAHCHAESGDGSETGCGMEYAYYAEIQTLKYWHDGVGQVMTREGFTVADRDGLASEHRRLHGN